MNKFLIKILMVCGLVSSPALADDMCIDDPSRNAYYEALQGKNVVFVPVALGFDLTDGWYAGMKAEL